MTFDPSDRNDLTLWVGAVRAVMPSIISGPQRRHSVKASGLWWPLQDRWAALRRLTDAPHRSARRALPAVLERPSEGSKVITVGINFIETMKTMEIKTMKPLLSKAASFAAGGVALLVGLALAGLGLWFLVILAMVGLVAFGLALIAAPFVVVDPDGEGSFSAEFVRQDKSTG